MLSGDQRILSEKPQYMSDSRQSVSSATYFFRHAPDTVYVTELRGSAQEICGWQSAVAYVFPFESPGTRMDSESAERFLNLLRAKDRDPLQTALLRMGLIRREDDPVLPRELSIARLPTLLTGFCACFRLRQEYKGFRYLGTCRIFCRRGTCPHELCARSLDGERECAWRADQNGPRRKNRNASSPLMRSRWRSWVPSGNTSPQCRLLRRCARRNS